MLPWPKIILMQFYSLISPVVDFEADGSPSAGA